MTRASAQDWVDDLLAGDRRTLARLITRVENRTPDSHAALARLYPHTGRAYLVGITGAPGTGKSTVVNALTRTLREREQTVGIIAVLLVIAFLMLPRGFSDDLSRIGQGNNVVVLTHNKEAVQSLDLMTLMNDVRADYAGQIEFLAVDIDTEVGKAFMEHEQIGGSALLLFGPDGARRGVLVSVRDQQTLRAALDNAFGISR